METLVLRGFHFPSAAPCGIDEFSQQQTSESDYEIYCSSTCSSKITISQEVDGDEENIKTVTWDKEASKTVTLTKSGNYTFTCYLDT